MIELSSSFVCAVAALVFVHVRMSLHVYDRPRGEAEPAERAWLQGERQQRQQHCPKRRVAGARPKARAAAAAARAAANGRSKSRLKVEAAVVQFLVTEYG